MSDVRMVAALTNSWAVKARENQRLPSGDWWSVWLMMSGRGWGKSRTLSEVCNSWAISGQYSRIAVVASTASDARDVMIEGESGILSTAPDWCRPIYQPTRRRLVWPNGAVAYTYSAEEPERLRGPQHDAAICDELASWSRPETFDMLMFGLRLGQRPRTVIGTTPTIRTSLIARAYGSLNPSYRVALHPLISQILDIDVFSRRFAKAVRLDGERAAAR